MRSLQILQQAEAYFAQKLLPVDREDDKYVFLPSRNSPVVIFATISCATIVEEIRSIRRVILPSAHDLAAAIFVRNATGWDYDYVAGKWADIIIPEFGCTMLLTDLFKGVTMPMAI